MWLGFIGPRGGNGAIRFVLVGRWWKRPWQHHTVLYLRKKKISMISKETMEKIRTNVLKFLIGKR